MSTLPVTRPDPQLMDYGNGSLLPPEKPTTTDEQILDNSWVKIAFMVPDTDFRDSYDVKKRYYSSASAKFTDTRLGCNIGINPRPQWTRYADIRVKGRLAGRNDVNISSTAGNFGMGRAYSEGIDDPSQRIYMRFGVPKFNSLMDYLFRAFDSRMTVMARTGRAPTAWYDLAKVVGTVITATSFPFLTIAVEAGRAISWLMGRETSKFFTLKPTMFYYWGMVNTLVNNHAVNTGIFHRLLAEDNEQRLGRPYKLDKDQMSMLKQLFPDIFSKSDYFDIYGMANKAQRLANQVFAEDYAKLNRGSATDFTGYLKRDNTGTGTHSTYITDTNGNPTLSAYLNNLLSFGSYYTAKENTEDAKASDTLEIDPRPNPSDSKSQLKSGLYHDNFMKAADSEWRDGSSFAIFRVDHTGSVGESFSNTTGESALAQKLNSTSSQVREARFSLADGNVFSGVLGSVVSAMTDVAAGALDGLSLGFAGLVTGLGGSGYVDIPKHWQSSSASLPRGSYTIQLISPYNNPISRMINIWIPFYMLLAGALPRSIGKQSYTSPFYCQLFDRGRLQSRLAMIESMSVTRGTSNLQFDTLGQALAIDVSITVVDLSSIMHMPMSSGGLFETDMTMDDDNIASDYLNVLAGMDIYSQIYPFPKAQNKMTKLLLKARQKATSPFYHAALFKNSVENGFINDLTFGMSGVASNLFVGAIHGSSGLDGIERGTNG